jgi:hypothetical protein
MGLCLSRSFGTPAHLDLSSVSLFDLEARFFVPTRTSLTPARAEAVKVGRRTNSTPQTGGGLLAGGGVRATSNSDLATWDGLFRLHLADVCACAGGSLLLDPAERWHYGMSTVVGKLVEKLSGQRRTYFHEHIFAPHQMSDTSYNVPLEKAARLDGSSPATLGSVRRLLCPPNRRTRNSMVGVSSREERSFSGAGVWLSAASHE